MKVGGQIIYHGPLGERSIKLVQYFEVGLSRYAFVQCQLMLFGCSGYTLHGRCSLMTQQGCCGCLHIPGIIAPLLDTIASRCRCHPNLLTGFAVFAKPAVFQLWQPFLINDILRMRRALRACPSWQKASTLPHGCCKSRHPAWKGASAWTSPRSLSAATCSSEPLPILMLCILMHSPIVCNAF